MRVKVSKLLDEIPNPLNRYLAIIAEDGILWATQLTYALGFSLRNPPPREKLERMLTEAYYVSPELKLGPKSYAELPPALKRAADEGLKRIPLEIAEQLVTTAMWHLVKITVYKARAKIVSYNDESALIEIRPDEQTGKTLGGQLVAVVTYKPGVAERKYDEWRRRYGEVKGLRVRGHTLIWATSAPTSAKEIHGGGELVAVKGFLVVSRLPSKNLLNARLPEIFKGSRIGRKYIQIVMGYFYNKLGTLSRKFYNEILPEHAIFAGFGYIVPYDKVNDFLKAVDELKEEYVKYEEQLKDFLLHGRIPPELLGNKRARIHKEYLELVMEYLRQHGKDEEVRRKIESLDIAGRVRINLLPFSIDPSILEEYVDERIKRRLEEELYAMRREIVEAAERELRERARKLLKRLEQYTRMTLTKRGLERIKREIESIERSASELGVEVPELRSVKELLTNPEKVIRLQASDRVKALLKSLKLG